MYCRAAVSCPDLPVKLARRHWAVYIGREADLDLLDRDALLHTDFNPLSILLAPDRVWIIDWAWPTRGAAFIDAAFFLIRAMAADHTATCTCSGVHFCLRNIARCKPHTRPTTSTTKT